MGIRTFSEINATMSDMTGVPTTNTAVVDVYRTYEQQLPTVENMDTFLGSHQMAVAQLALTYCSELVDNRGSISRDAYFSGFDFGQPANTAFDSATKVNAILDPLLTATMNIDAVNGNLTSQPEEGTLTDNGMAIDGAHTRGLLGSTESQTLDTGAQTVVFDGLIETMINQCVGAQCTTTARTAEIVKATCAAAVGSGVMLIQ
jgi:hypothetical protein